MATTEVLQRPAGHTYLTWKYIPKEDEMLQKNASLNEALFKPFYFLLCVHGDKRLLGPAESRSAPFSSYHEGGKEEEEGGQPMQTLDPAPGASCYCWALQSQSPLSLLEGYREIREILGIWSWNPCNRSPAPLSWVPSIKPCQGSWCWESSGH